MEREPFVGLSYEQKAALVASLVPSAETLEKMSHKKVIAVVGPSAAGKTTIMQKFVETYPELADMIQNETSREPSPKELAEGSEYIHHTEEEIEDDIKHGRLAQVMLHPNGDYYCTRPDDYPDDKIGLMAVIANVLPIFRELHLETFTPVFISNSPSELLHRMKLQSKERGWSREKFFERKNEGQESAGLALADPTMRFILNDTPEAAVERIYQAIKGEKVNDEEKARDLAGRVKIQL